MFGRGSPKLRKNIWVPLVIAGVAVAVGLGVRVNVGVAVGVGVGLEVLVGTGVFVDTAVGVGVGATLQDPRVKPKDDAPHSLRKSRRVNRVMIFFLARVKRPR